MPGSINFVSFALDHPGIRYRLSAVVVGIVRQPNMPGSSLFAVHASQCHATGQLVAFLKGLKWKKQISEWSVLA
ncbi:hypothetical protein OHAE_2900 [Ochrobactrum soli]|uniref:Uncharacterized protein n=1 Tax=Ochrobactrum soli TaxID=2448455 RepID=A0A2P9HFU1_9HYPH|nr:hypothetical protein OHAE_2900 [[Ochrobactrum] soli]